MSNVLEYVVRKTVTSVECCQCGHLIFMTSDFEERRRRDHRSWFCTNCGASQSWKQESDIEKAKRELKAAQQREETLRQQRLNLEIALEKEQKSKARLKKRAANGVCPCCTRTFTNLRRHMTTKHPDHATTV